jgi:hypothetical protein
MKTETITYVRESTSSAGLGWVSGTAAPDSVASQIKNCTIVREPKMVVRGNALKFTAVDSSALKRPQPTLVSLPKDSAQK